MYSSYIYELMYIYLLKESETLIINPFSSGGGVCCMYPYHLKRHIRTPEDIQVSHLGSPVVLPDSTIFQIGSDGPDGPESLFVCCSLSTRHPKCPGIICKYVSMTTLFVLC
jgi:hypothetical protein